VRFALKWRTASVFPHPGSPYKNKGHPVAELIVNAAIIYHIGAFLSPLKKNLYPGFFSFNVRIIKKSAASDYNEVKFN
jgi:hypothetical protein